MRRWHSGLVVSFVAATAPSGPAQDETLAERFRADVAALVAPETAGRDAGSPGGRRAEDFLGARFLQIGLVAPEGLAGYRQEFDVPDPRPPRIDPDATALATRGAGTERSWPVGDGFVPFGFSADGRATGSVTFVGYGLVVPGLERDDLAGLELNGAVALVVRGAPGWRDPDSPFREHRAALRFTEKIARVRDAGAVGFLLVDADGPADAVAERALLTRAASAQGESALPAAWISRACAEALLGANIEAALAAGRGPRPAAVDLRIRVAERRPRRGTANLVGLLPGADPRLRDEWVVIGAHHDHIGLGEVGSLRPDAIGRVHPGADDNASGCAAMLAVAAAIARGPRPPRTIAFVAFGAEELGLRGSERFLGSGLVAAPRIVAMLNLNMVGRATPDRLRVEGVGTGSGFAALLDDVAERIGIAPHRRDAASPRSDHAAFLARRIPALFVHSGLHDAYHTPDDVAERVLVPEALGVARLVEALARSLADGRTRPEFREVATGFGTRR